jgi:accessory colonization factor AcfC
MKDTALHKIELIKSDSLREIATYLLDSGIQVTFFGQAWSNVSGDWIYFDTILNLKRLKRKFNLKDNIVIHENLDPKSGTERGFVDNETGEGLMGKLK